ncbi:hypothetical protein DAPPUDRAFT_113609 [Daphnia pulex]|uniref:Uncharacterized protein n=1 Tax=Daphnia pulex TaxID=6669 RepID=E9HFH2_DAPPU|nr:hypothetical protein DAPPUDRAFT_113609 [Daphnia pulex]|eukprot:EFX69529.1 hypothetical protein DAPPUDRAFT_113609 [Daphnia pulex]
MLKVVVNLEEHFTISYKLWDGFRNIGELVIRFLYVVDSMSPHLTDRESQQLEECYSNIIRCYFSERSKSVIHAAIWYADDYGFDPDVVLKLVKLSLKLGADPNAIDQFGHLDMATFNGDTVLGILKQSLQYVKNNSQLLDYNAPPYYASLLNIVSPLSCYCTRVIREHGIPLNEGWLPLRLQEFVSRHCGTEVYDEDDVPSTYVYHMGR